MQLILPQRQKRDEHAAWLPMSRDDEEEVK
jgi:hypothetical protein